MQQESSGYLREREFEELVGRALGFLMDVESIEREPHLGERSGPDFVARLRDGRVAVIEVRATTPATEARVRDAASRLLAFGSMYERFTSSDVKPDLVFITSGVLTPERVSLFKAAGVTTVLDGPALADAVPALPWPQWGPRKRPIEAAPESPSGELIYGLKQIAPGREGWAAYQRNVRDILAALWCPPLEQPISELSNSTGVNRRDIIFPNYATAGIWMFLRDHYQAHYVVVDAKNYNFPIKKDEVLQIANYLGDFGAGLFGVIVCRSGVSDSAEITRREQWVLHRKLLVFLTDEDLEQMASFASNDIDPATVVRQKIEDFRLSV